MNVLGDAMGSGIIYHLSRDDLKCSTLDSDAQQLMVLNGNNDGDKDLVSLNV